MKKALIGIVGAEFFMWSSIILKQVFSILKPTSG